MTREAARALDELSPAGFINGVLRGGLLQPMPEQADFHPMWRLYQQAEWYLTCREITHAADVLTTYCQSILASALEHSLELWDEVQPILKTKKTREEAIQELRMQRMPDGKVRSVSSVLGTFWNAEIDLIVVLRNKIVHQGGFDQQGEIESAIQTCRAGRTILRPISQLSGEIPIEVDAESRKLRIDAKTATWASEHVFNNIWMMDQNWRAHFKIPHVHWIQPKASLIGRGPCQPRFLERGVPLPVNGPAEDLPQPPPLPAFPDYSAMQDSKDIDCARSWNHLRAEIHQLIEAYCNEVGGRIMAMAPAIAGRFPSATVVDHEHHLGYQISNGDPDSWGSSVCVRLRQRGKVPFLTVWSDQTLMRDFDVCELTEAVKEHLRDCIAEACSR